MRIPFLGFLACLSLSAHAQIQLSGNVYDVDGKPKAGVVISLANAGLSDTTDATGAWSLVSDVQSVAPRTLDRSRWNGRDLSLRLEKTSLVRAELFDARGARVGERFERLLGPGAHAVRLTSREAVGGRWLRLSIDGQTRVLSGASGLSASPSEVPAPLARSAESLERLIYRFQGQILTEDVLSTLIKAGIQKWIQGHLIKGNVLLDSRVKLDTVFAYFDGGRMTSVRRARVGYSADLKEYSGMFFTIRDDNNGQIAYRTWIEVLGNGLKKVGVSDTVNFNSDFGQITVPTFRLGNAIPTPVITGSSPVAHNVANTFVVDPQDAGKDILSITWSDGTGWSATGRTVQRSWPRRGEQRLKVEVVDVEGNRDSAVRRVYVDTAVPPALVWHDSLGATTQLLGDRAVISMVLDTTIFNRIVLDFGDSTDGIGLRDTVRSGMELSVPHIWTRLGRQTIYRTLTTRGGVSKTDSMTIFVKDWLHDARDGKRYPIVSIGSQVWMAKSLAFDTLVAERRVSYNAEIKRYFVDTLDFFGNPSRELRVVNDFQPDFAPHRGYLYEWSSAHRLPDSCDSASGCVESGVKWRGICPEGWHLPSTEELTVLRKYVATIYAPEVGTPYAAVGKLLRSERGWIGMSGDVLNPYAFAGQDPVGFGAIPEAAASMIEGVLGFQINSDGNALSQFWVSGEADSSSGKSFLIRANQDNVTTLAAKKSSLIPVRCLKD